LNILRHIAVSNGYNINIIDKLIAKHKIKNRVRPIHDDINNTNKYISIQYTSLLPNVIRNQFKKYGIAVSFKAVNTIGKALRPKERIHELKSRSGVYKIACGDCDKFYIGQTGRRFEDRFKEHLPRRNILHNKSTYAQHLIDCGHNYGSFSDSLEPLHFCGKGRYMDALEEYEIYKAANLHKERLLNDMISFKSNALFDTVLRRLSQT
jgi:hypothetical protein